MNIHNVSQFTMTTFDNHKTKWCQNGQDCEFGKRCSYAHTMKELRRTKMCHMGDQCHNKMCTYAHNKSELTGPRDLRWTKMCRKMNCTSAMCTYAHSTDELVTSDSTEPMTVLKTPFAPKKRIDLGTRSYRPVTPTSPAPKQAAVGIPKPQAKKAQPKEIPEERLLEEDETYTMFQESLARYKKYLEENDLDDECSNLIFTLTQRA